MKIALSSVLSCLVLISSVNSAVGQRCNGHDAIEYGALKEGFCAYEWKDDLSNPRGILIAPTGELLVVEQGAQPGVVSSHWDADNDGESDDDEEATIAVASGDSLNHGIAINGNYLYASSQSKVYRWSISGGVRTNLGTPETVVQTMPTESHETRTLAFDPNGRIYVTVGSRGNIDTDTERSNIRRFDLTTIPAGGHVWSDGVNFAAGLRNEVGLRFDANGGLWGVENGVDWVTKDGVDVHEDNPAEELNYFGNYATATPGLFYGYPYCWSVYNLSGSAPLTQFAWDAYKNDGTHTDAWCQDTNNVVVPKLALPAHNAPLDIIFYNSDDLPGIASGDAFVTLHGSWNRDVPSGYRVVHVPFSNGNPTSFEPFFYYDSTAAKSTDWQIRPVALAFGKCGNFDNCMFVSSDATGEIIVIVPEAGTNDAVRISGIFAVMFALLSVILF